MAFTLLRHVKRCSPKRVWNYPALNAFVTRSAATGVHLPFWEPGSGHFGNTLGQNNKGIVEGSIGLILPRLDKIPVPARNGVFTIGDYGTSDGSTSMTLVRKIIDESSYLHDFTNVYTMASNTNFYKQVVPNETCDVIFTSIATHWLEDDVPPVRSSVFDVTATDEELLPFKRASARSWEKFLLLRAKELKPGGLLIALAITNDDKFDGVRRPRTRSELTADTPMVNIHGVLLDLQDSWRELMEKSVITQEEYHATFAKGASRTGSEITLPFKESTSPVVLAGLNMVYHDQVLADCAFKAMWREKLQREGIDDRECFAARLAEAHRVWCNASFRSGLSDSRTEEEKDAVLDQFYDTFRRRVAEADPATYRSEIFLSRLIAQKKMK
ncbi:hypothetical protein BaRGS_00036102 [Batillaria attramentaria]|uniref:Uncharacterized protein n=1 Tax=Batillaria attramentaria TaxID=370345 RepID=A0ABD0JE14_9CAEN